MTQTNDLEALAAITGIIENGVFDDVPSEDIAKSILTALRAQDAAPVAWECFRDAAYYDMWCVRPKGSRAFGEGFHLVNGEEAEALRELLSTRPTATNGDKDAVIAELEREHGYHPNHGVPSMNAKIEQRHRQRLVELLNGLHGLGVLYNIALQLIANADAAARVYLEDHRKVGPHIIRLRCPDDTETKETEK